MDQEASPLDYQRVEAICLPIFKAIRGNYLLGPTSRDRALEALNALAACAATVIVGCDGPGGEAESFFQKALCQNIQNIQSGSAIANGKAWSWGNSI